MDKDEFIEFTRKRLLLFSFNCISFLSKTYLKHEHIVLKLQLSKCSTAIGANFIEAQATSYKEFTHKMRIALREANESKYWLTIIHNLNLGDANVRSELLKEINEIRNLLGSIVSNCDQNIKKNAQKT